ncbi:MAG: hypothetical protein AB4352_03835 [Hormoscilla sp.]
MERKVKKRQVSRTVKARAENLPNLSSEISNVKEKSEEVLEKYEGLIEQLQQRGVSSENIVIEQPGTVKMSEVLTDFIQIYMELVDSQTALENLISLAVIAWNISLFAYDEGKYVEEPRIAEKFPKYIYIPESLFYLVNHMISRKQLLFSEYHQEIIGFELKNTGNDFALLVSSKQSW